MFRSNIAYIYNLGGMFVSATYMVVINDQDIEVCCVLAHILRCWNYMTLLYVGSVICIF